jgi:hypothetical protein
MPMPTIASPTPSDQPLAEAAPGPLPRPPGRPPAEPIVIRKPPRPPDGLEVETPDDADGDGDTEVEIKRPPPWIPDLPPPAPPEGRAARR